MVDAPFHATKYLAREGFERGAHAQAKCQHLWSTGEECWSFDLRRTSGASVLLLAYLRVQEIHANKDICDNKTIDNVLAYASYTAALQ